MDYNDDEVVTMTRNVLQLEAALRWMIQIAETSVSDVFNGDGRERRIREAKLLLPYDYPEMLDEDDTPVLPVPKIRRKRRKNKEKLLVPEKASTHWPSVPPIPVPEGEGAVVESV